MALAKNRRRRIFWQLTPRLCYALFVERSLNSPRMNVSPRTSFRLLSYTASYF
jgi:hypothetical protein